MDALFHGGSDTFILLLIAALTYMFKRQFTSYDKKHDKHFEHAAKAEIHREGMDSELIMARLENVHLEIQHLTQTMTGHIQDDRNAFDSLSKEMLESRRLTHERFNELTKLIGTRLS